ncbi:unnamed protein product, partial [Mesorhabditis belari]|uniref:G-protein coupled receptors family 2 profile 2 domain-containing protein n=1 Tax=Mesorhabditis belari TaxID=2138241 RepID=A0AAF3FGV0_9BILA
MTEWRYVTNMPFVCELFFFVLEYGKICVVAWIFLETFYVHNRICWNLCRKESLAAYLGFGYLLPFINAIFWLFSLWKDHDFKMEKCLGSYYLRSMLILSVPKLITNTLTMIMLLNIARVLLCHYKNYVPTVEYKRIKIHIVIAFFLFLLVAIPEILHLFPLSLNKNTFLLFKIYSYTLTISMVLQGIIVAVIFLLLNKEVIDEFRDLSWRRKNSKIVLQNQTLTEYTQ